MMYFSMYFITNFPIFEIFEIQSGRFGQNLPEKFNSAVGLVRPKVDKAVNQNLSLSKPMPDCNSWLCRPAPIVQAGRAK
jgi:hypothetical protein